MTDNTGNRKSIGFYADRETQVALDLIRATRVPLVSVSETLRNLILEERARIIKRESYAADKRAANAERKRLKSEA